MRYEPSGTASGFSTILDNIADGVALHTLRAWVRGVGRRQRAALEASEPTSWPLADRKCDRAGGLPAVAHTDIDARSLAG